jgi:hypothetical protein
MTKITDLKSAYASALAAPQQNDDPREEKIADVEAKLPELPPLQSRPEARSAPISQRPKRKDEALAGQKQWLTARALWQKASDASGSNKLFEAYVFFKAKEPEALAAVLQEAGISSQSSSSAEAMVHWMVQQPGEFTFSSFKELLKQASEASIEDGKSEPTILMPSLKPGDPQKLAHAISTLQASLAESKILEDKKSADDDFFEKSADYLALCLQKARLLKPSPQSFMSPRLMGILASSDPVSSIAQEKFIAAWKKSMQPAIEFQAQCNFAYELAEKPRRWAELRAQWEQLTDEKRRSITEPIAKKSLAEPNKWFELVDMMGPRAWQLMQQNLSTNPASLNNLLEHIPQDKEFRKLLIDLFEKFDINKTQSQATVDLWKKVLQLCTIAERCIERSDPELRDAWIKFALEPLVKNPTREQYEKFEDFFLENILCPMLDLTFATLQGKIQNQEITRADLIEIAGQLSSLNSERYQNILQAYARGRIFADDKSEAVELSEEVRKIHAQNKDIVGDLERHGIRKEIFQQGAIRFTPQDKKLSSKDAKTIFSLSVPDKRRLGYLTLTPRGSLFTSMIDRVVYADQFVLQTTPQHGNGKAAGFAWSFLAINGDDELCLVVNLFEIHSRYLQPKALQQQLLGTLIDGAADLAKQLGVKHCLIRQNDNGPLQGALNNEFMTKNGSLSVSTHDSLSLSGTSERDVDMHLQALDAPERLFEVPLDKPESAT